VTTRTTATTTIEPRPGRIPFALSARFQRISVG
jgi:hypothetical protein